MILAVLEGCDCEKGKLQSMLSFLRYFALLQQAGKNSIKDLFDVFNLPASPLSTVLRFTSQALSVTGCSQSLLIKAVASKTTLKCLFPFSIHYDD